MRNLFVVIAVIILVGIAYMLLRMKITRTYNGFSIRQYMIENKTLQLMVADTHDKWTQGLMFIKNKPETVDGMIFVFPDKDYRTFWNQNTHLNLELIWMNEGKVIGKTKLPSIDKTREPITVTSPDKADVVVEIIE